MLAYLEKFNKLPAEVKQKISSPEIVAKITQLEKEYGVKLAILIIKIITKETTLSDLENKLVISLGTINAKKLINILQIEIFQNLVDGLNLGQDEEKKLLAEQSVVKYAGDGETSNQLPAVKETVIKGASFFFSSDDEAEIRELTKKIGSYSKNTLPEEILLNQIIDQVKIYFSAESLVERFKQFLKTYLRGIRSRLEIKQTLIKSFEFGGLSFDEDSAEQVLVIVDKNLKNPNQQQELKQPIGVSVSEVKKDVAISSKNIGMRDFEYDLSSLVKQKKDEPKTAESPVEGSSMTLAEKADSLAGDSAMITKDIKQEFIQLPSVVVKAVEPVKLVEKKATQKVVLTQKIEESKQEQKTLQKNNNLSAQPTQPIFRSKTTLDNKIKMEDVKFAPRIMSPLDELKYLNLINFRRLGLDEKKIIEKIKEKINLLEGESYAKRLGGIKAWRSSFVNKIYLDMGRDSISNNKPINVIIEERKKKNKDFLTVLEFEAISDLNKSLRF